MMYKNDLQVKKIKVRKVCIVVYYFHKCFYVCVNVEFPGSRHKKLVVLGFSKKVNC